MNMKFLMGSVLVLSSSVLAFETWVGIDGVYWIKTELDNGTGTSGYWYEFDDNAEGGESELDWHGISLKTDYSDWSFDNVIERCGGLCGSAELRAGTLSFNPYVGMAFNVAGTATETGGAPTRVDAVDWDGICVAYTSDIDLSVELSMSDSVDKAINKDYPKVILPKSATTTYECNEWLDFVQAGWGVKGGGEPITSLEAAAALASVRFTFQGKDGSYDFEIRAVGPYTAKGDFERIVERIIARDDSVAAEYVRQDSIAKAEAEARQDSIEKAEAKARQDSIKKAVLARIDSIAAEKARLDSIAKANSRYRQDDESGLEIPSGQFVTWRGEEGGYVVNTGLDNGTNTSGFWYVISDNADGGKSAIDWNGISIDKGINNVIDKCGGICGTAVLDVGDFLFEKNPFVGLAFDVAGIGLRDDYIYDFADATDWGGLCVSYSSEVPMIIELSDPYDKEIAYDYHKYEFPKSDTVLNKCAKWSDFKQSGWGVTYGGITEKVEYVIDDLKTIRFKFQAKDGSYKFNIKAVGPYTAKSEFPVGPEEPDDSGKTDSSGKFVTWYGDDGSFRIKTGLDNGTNTSGYWYYISDKSDGGKSKVEWESYIDELVLDQTSGPMMDVIIDENEAVCGTAVLKANSDPLFVPYAGVAFDVAGTKTEDGGPVTAADASDWGGICITYTSEIEPVLEIGFTAKGDSAVAYDFPAARLPKASSPKTRCVAWSDFEQAGWGKKKGGVSISGEKAATKIASVKFVLQDDPGSYKFKIYAVGPYGSLGGGDLVKGFRVASSAKAVLSNKKLSFTGVTSAATVQVVDILGHVVVKASVEPTSSLDLSRLKAGRYIVRVAGKDVGFTTGITLK